MPRYDNNSEHWYVDGSASQAGRSFGPGGCSALRVGYKNGVMGGKVSSAPAVLELLHHSESKTTNNRMELMAVLLVLRKTKGKHFTFYTDSQYTMNCATGKFKRSANLDLWAEYDHWAKGKDIKWVKVKGHSGDQFNELADLYAREKTEIQKEINRHYRL